MDEKKITRLVIRFIRSELIGKALQKLFFGLLLLCTGHTGFATSFPLPPRGTDIVGRIRIVSAKPEDTLLDIARRYDLGYNEITEANPDVDPWLPGAGTRIVLPTQFILPDAPRRGIVLNLAAMRLYYYPVPRVGETPRVITYPIGIGRIMWETPLVNTRIKDKIVNPAWHIPASIRAEHAKEGVILSEVVAPGPDNPLGKYAMPLGIAGYLIHGTDRPYGIGRRVSHGCIHLYPEDIERLFRKVPIGTRVRIVNQPYLAGWLDGHLYLEAHKPLQEDNWSGSLTPMVRAILAKAPSFPINWEKATRVAEQARSIPVRVSPADSHR